MPEFLLELLSEEIPARMQARAADDLMRLFTAKLKDAGLAFTKAAPYVTPRRLALHVDGLPERQPDLREEKKGPRVGAPEAAIAGFLKSVGLAGLDQCEKRVVGKAEFWFAAIERKGQPTEALLPALVAEVVAAFAWPKSMRWAANSLRWVRPLRNVLCLWDGRSLDGAIVLNDATGDALTFSGTTIGHRFLAA
jgi:glycyl-tRNA synthetase beta chain